MRKCTICALPKETLTAIEKATVSGDSIASVARDFTVSEDALRRHAKSHIPPKVLKSLERGRDKDQAQEGSDLENYAKGLMAKAVSYMHQAEAEGDIRTANVSIRSALACMQELAKMRGLYQNGGSGPEVNVAIIQADLEEEHRRWAERKLTLWRVLRPYPEVLAKVQAALNGANP